MARAWPLLAWGAALLAPLPALAQAEPPVVVSARIDDAAVTVYRAPNRGGGPINPNWPQGFAFITETRTVTLPAGTSILRFEGVAEGLLPETAVVSGLPDGVIEKNRDARLLSPAGLVDAYLKRSVTLRRTSLATGKVVEQDAVIQAGPNGGVICRPRRASRRSPARDFPNGCFILACQRICRPGRRCRCLSKAKPRER